MYLKFFKLSSFRKPYIPIFLAIIFLIVSCTNTIFHENEITSEQLQVIQKEVNATFSQFKDEIGMNENQKFILNGDSFSYRDFPTSIDTQMYYNTFIRNLETVCTNDMEYLFDSVGLNYSAYEAFEYFINNQHLEDVYDKIATNYPNLSESDIELLFTMVAIFDLIQVNEDGTIELRGPWGIAFSVAGSLIVTLACMSNPVTGTAMIWFLVGKGIATGGIIASCADW